MAEKEEETEERDAEHSLRRGGIEKRHAKLDLYGKQVDSIEDELRAWSELISKSEREAEEKRGFLGRRKVPKRSRFRLRKRERK